MKVSALLLVTLVSSVAAHPGDLNALVENVANAVDTRGTGFQLVDDLVNNARGKYIPSLSADGYASRADEASSRGGTGLMNLDLASSLQSMMGKDNFFVSAISKTIGAAGDMMGEIAGNIEKGTGLPLRSIGETIKGVILGRDESDSGLSEGHESRDNDDSQASIGVEGAGAWKEGGTYGYREQDGAKEASSEKRGIHSAGSQGSSSGGAKTEGEEKGRPWISTESTEASAKAELQDHSSGDTGKESLGDEGTEASRGSTSADKQEVIVQVENRSKSAKEVDRKSVEA